MRRRAVAAEELERGRLAYAAHAWAKAHGCLTRADEAAPLGAEGLEMLATTASMLGRDDDSLRALERAHHAHARSGATPPAVRCAFWLAVTLLLRGELARANGWLSRARRMLDRHGRDCAEHGYLLAARVFELEAAGDLEAAVAAASEAAAVGERFGDLDLFGLAAQTQGNLLVAAGRTSEGLALLDEAMVAVTTGELSPIVTGLVYCGVILGCQAAYEPRRAREWTAALTTWCDQQPDMVAFTGRCLVHRAEIMCLRGAWADALAEARRAGTRCERAGNRAAAGEAGYLRGEVHRLRGELAAAEAAFRQVAHDGCEPQPGLALVRLAQADTAAAAAAIGRALDEAVEVPRRARLLPAAVEISLAAGDPAAARRACAELEQLARENAGAMLRAVADYARGSVELAAGDARRALVHGRRAARAWREIDAPYELARSRSLAARACRALGDEEAARSELAAARELLSHLGVAPARAAGSAALTPRERQVLRLVAAGRTNREIAVELVVSPRTVDRHVSNILAKLGTSSRAAATAHGFEHGLL